MSALNSIRFKKKHEQFLSKCYVRRLYVLFYTTCGSVGAQDAEIEVILPGRVWRLRALEGSHSRDTWLKVLTDALASGKANAASAPPSITPAAFE